MVQLRKRKQAKNDHSVLVAVIVLGVIFTGLALLIASPSNPTQAGQPALGEDAFYGIIQNVRFVGKTTGIVKADTNCKLVEKGLTNCIGIITASDGRELDFNYKHDMSRQECLATGDKVTIVLLENGTVKVLRG
jgi:hypothetical protein